MILVEINYETLTVIVSIQPLAKKILSLLSTMPFYIKTPAL